MPNLKVRLALALHLHPLQLVQPPDLIHLERRRGGGGRGNVDQRALGFGEPERGVVVVVEWSVRVGERGEAIDGGRGGETMAVLPWGGGSVSGGGGNGVTIGGGAEKGEEEVAVELEDVWRKGRKDEEMIDELNTGLSISATRGREGDSDLPLWVTKIHAMINPLLAS
jgi:hypothetical protein